MREDVHAQMREDVHLRLSTYAIANVQTVKLILQWIYTGETGPQRLVAEFQSTHAQYFAASKCALPRSRIRAGRLSVLESSPCPTTQLCVPKPHGPYATRARFVCRLVAAACCRRSSR
eukprot:5882346-Pleurochrysis_carterae.AAC.1